MKAGAVANRAGRAMLKLQVAAIALCLIKHSPCDALLYAWLDMEQGFVGTKAHHFHHS